jgi:hypothetical protein
MVHALKISRPISELLCRVPLIIQLICRIMNCLPLDRNGSGEGAGGRLLHPDWET